MLGRFVGNLIGRALELVAVLHERAVFLILEPVHDAAVRSFGIIAVIVGRNHRFECAGAYLDRFVLSDVLAVEGQAGYDPDGQLGRNILHPAVA